MIVRSVGEKSSDYSARIVRLLSKKAAALHSPAAHARAPARTCCSSASGPAKSSSGSRTSSRSDHGESSRFRPRAQNSASIQPRTSPVEFARSPCTVRIIIIRIITKCCRSPMCYSGLAEVWITDFADHMFRPRTECLVRISLRNW